MNAPNEAGCAKCGARDPVVMYHVGESYWGDTLTCGYGAAVHEWANTTREEHLHYRCTVCGYDWTAQTLDSSAS